MVVVGMIGMAAAVAVFLDNSNLGITTSLQNMVMTFVFTIDYQH